MESTIYDHNCHRSLTVEYGQPTASAVMFSLGVLGNLIALALLEMRRRRQSPSLFHILVTALVMTDLLGTISVSPLVLASYTNNKTLVGMSDGGAVCAYFGFSMTFLSLATLAILCAMALERYLSIGHPYFYERHLSKRCGYITIPLIYLVCVLFCVTPFLGVGEFVQYCPGTWCFIDMSPIGHKGKVYAGLYASLTLFMTLCTVFCNVSVICHLISMHRRHKAHRRGVVRQSRMYRRSFSMTEEVEHLLLLGFITVAFVIFSFPLVLRVYVNFTGRTEERPAADLFALRLLSFNSIIDPWVFIILNPSVLRFFWRKLCKPQKPTLPQEKAIPIQPKLVQPSPPMEQRTTEWTGNSDSLGCHDPLQQVCGVH